MHKFPFKEVDRYLRLSSIYRYVDVNWMPDGLRQVTPPNGTYKYNVNGSNRLVFYEAQ